VNNTIVKPVVSWVSNTIVRPLQQALSYAASAIPVFADLVYKGAQSLYETGGQIINEALGWLSSQAEQVQAAVYDFMCNTAASLGTAWEEAIDYLDHSWSTYTDPLDWYRGETANGTLDWLIDLGIGAKPEDGIYHIDQDYWQSWEPIGYNEFYDFVLKTASGAAGGSAAATKFDFVVDGVTYTIWAWKGDYINLGAGAETGVYKQGIGSHRFTAPEFAMPMTLKLENVKTGETYYDWKPEEKKW
jgi:hypothetical protein